MYKFVVFSIGLALLWNWWLPKQSLVKVKLDSQYDYIIVGAGSAGAIVATRLSEDPSVNVALLEAGPDNDDQPEAAIPLSFIKLLRNSENWLYTTERQNQSCLGLVDQRSFWPRGRALGGSSLINAMMVTRGSRHDYDLWEEMGNTGWGFKDVLPYFKKIETVTKNKWKASGLRGTEGPISITEPAAFSELSEAVLEAAKSQGFDISGDTNGEEMVNRMMRFQANINEKGERQDTAVTYLKPAMPQQNLHVLTEATVTKVVFEGKRAVGVEYVHRGRVVVIKARKEVILSAGAIESPKTLMLSGIGPKQHLEDMKIPVLSNLPVGNNLKDHIMVENLMYTINKPISLMLTRLSIMDLLQYKIFGTGPLSAVGMINTGFKKSKHQPKNANYPFLQYIIFGGLLNDPDGFAKTGFNLKPEVYEALHGNLEGRDGLIMLTKLLQPKSAGWIRLKSTNPFDPPIIDPQYLTHQQDVDVLIDGIRTAQKILESKVFIELVGAKPIKRIHPNCIKETYDSDAYWECYIRSNTLTVYHPVSTCRMGPDGDENSVIDTKLRVRGVEGLRVVDASVMPQITSGNTNFPIMMIAEKAADIIKGLD